MNKKGFTEWGVAVMSLVITGVVAAAGTGVRSSNPAVLGISVFAEGMTLYSQMPHVKRGFRERKAAELGIVDPESLSDEALLASIRDDDMSGDKGFASGNKAPDFTNISRTHGVPAIQ